MMQRRPETLGTRGANSASNAGTQHDVARRPLLFRPRLLEARRVLATSRQPRYAPTCLTFVPRLTSFLAALCLAGTAVAATPPWLTVAVFDVESKDQPSDTWGAKIASLVHAQLSSDPGIVTVERVEMTKILGEHELGLSGATTSEASAKTGQWLGAQVLVTGRTFKAGDYTAAVAKIIGTETSRVYGELARTDRPDDPTLLAEEISRKILRTLHEKHASLVSPARSPEQRLESLVGSLGSGPRPTVSVRITETHVGTPATDPAAETEWIRVLQKAGFTVLDRQSRETADLTLDGEGFSAFGLRKGNLVACRARIEIRLHETRTGRLRLADRQTGVALDIAEPIAAKAALEDAALTLAERVLPRLASSPPLP